MAVTIEALLEENLGKAQELLNASNTIFADVSALDDLGEWILAEVESSSAPTLEGLQELQETIASLTTELEQAEQGSNTKFDELNQQIASAQESSESNTGTITQAITAAKEMFTAAESALETEQSTAETQLQALQEEAVGYKQFVDTTFDKSKEDAEEFQTKVEASMASIEAKKTTIESDYDAMQSVAQEELATLVESIEKGTEETRQKLEATLEATVQMSSKSSANMREKIFEDGVNTFVKDIEDVTSTIDSISETTEKLGINVGDSLEGVMDNIEEVVALVEKVKPILDLADDLL
jgi:hypothetical protein